MSVIDSGYSWWTTDELLILGRCSSLIEASRKTGRSADACKLMLRRSGLPALPLHNPKDQARKRRRALYQVRAGASMRAAAKMVGVHGTTVMRWMRDSA